MSFRKTIYLAMASLLVSAGLAALAPSADAATPRHRSGQAAARHHSVAPHHTATRQARAARPARATAARRGADGESAQVDALNQQSLQAARGGAAAQ